MENSSTKKKFRETGFGRFLTEKIPNALAVVGDVLPDSGVLGVAKNIISSSTLSEEEKHQLLEQAKQFELDELKVYMADVQDARNRDVKVNEAQYASWLSKNISPLIAITWNVAVILILGMSLSSLFPTDKTIEAQIIQGVFGIAMLILGYYFGSSKHGSSTEFNLLKSEKKQ